MKYIHNTMTIAGLIVFLAGVVMVFAIQDMSLISGAISFGLVAIGITSVFTADVVTEMTSDM